MLHCPYEQNRHPPLDDEGEPQNESAQCMVLSIACGFVVSNGERICAYCIGGTAWNDATNVPQLQPEDVERTPVEKDVMALVQESPFFKSLHRQSLHARLIDGDCPRYQGPNPVDLGTAFAKYRIACGDSAAEGLLADMLDIQLGKAESNIDGVHPESVVRDKIATLAEDNGFMLPAEAADLRAGQ